MKNIENEDRALRGGSWFCATGYCRASSHYRYEPGDRNINFGFRVALSSPQDRFPSAISPSNGSPPQT